MTAFPHRRRLALIVAAAAALAMATLCALRLKVTTDITHFLPAGTDRGLGQLTRQLADSALTRNLILSVGAAEPARARAAAAQMAAHLARHPEVAWIQRGPTEALAAAVYGLYAPRLASFVSDRPETEIPPALNDDGLARAAQALKRQLALPTAPLVARLAAADPLQWFPAILRRLERAQARALDVDGDQLFTRDHRHAIVFVGLRHSPFDSRAQAPLLEEIDLAFDQANRQAGGGLTLERAGVAPIALDAERRIRGDLTRISVLSTVGVIVLFLALFGSIRSAVLAFLPVAAGALTSLTVGLLLFGTVHAMTLAIGSTLIGVAIDYPILLLTHRALAPDEPIDGVVARIWVGIVLGGITTAAGFAALAWTSFPGVREMAVTSSAGIIAALAVTRYVLPPLCAGRPPRAPALWRASAQAMRALGWAARRRWLAPAFLAALALVCAVGLPRLRWLDSLAALNAADPRLKAESDRVRASISNLEEGRLVIASAPTEEQALRINDRVAALLEGLAGAGAIDGAASLHAFLWSADLQSRNRAAVAAAPALGARTFTALGREGFRTETFAPFLRDIDGPRGPAAPPPLRLGDLQGSALAPLVRPFVVQLGDEVGILTFLRGVKQPAAIEAALAGLAGARYFDQAAFLDRTYARFRVQTLQAIGVGLALILLVLHVRYRAWRRTMAALLPAVIAAAATLGVLGVAGVPATLLHVLSLLIVLSVGVDYGVFLAESPGGRASGATMVGLVASCATAVLSFGLLALSATQALRAIGLTVGVGVVLSLALAPMAALATKPTATPTATGAP
jgi:predicted exporter